MEKTLLSNQLENKYSFDKVSKAADYINAAAELLDDTGFFTEAETLTNILEKLSSSNKEQPLSVEEIVMEPLNQKIEVMPKDAPFAKIKPGDLPLKVDFETNQILEMPYLEYKALAQVAQKITDKYAKKKA